jgi:acetyl-CoA decarbonylase/synthase complex subunit gamma
VLLPLLSATGVRAREVRAATGFDARFAAIRAGDLPEYLDNGFRTTDAMRGLTFTLRERAALAPVDFVLAVRGAWPVLAACLAAGLVSTGGAIAPASFLPAATFLAALACGTVGVPLLLPWLPGRAFSIKGALLGLLPVAAAGTVTGGSPIDLLPALLFLPAASAYYALNFTGSTPYTSRSGVKKEIRLGIPPMAAAALSGILAWIVSRFTG